MADIRWQLDCASEECVNQTGIEYFGVKITNVVKPGESSSGEF